MNKTIIFGALAALTVLGMSSCSKNEISSDDTQAIGFGVYSPKAVTKSNGSYVSGNELVDGQKFVVNAYNQGATDYSASTVFSANFMKSVAVTYNGGKDTETASKNTYSPLRYWPKDEANNKLAFFAYYPDAVSAPTVGSTAGTLGTFNDFTVDTDSTNQVDFLVADLVKDQVYSTNSGVVPFKFKHMLTKVQFAVKTDKDYSGNATISLTSLKVKALTKGTLTATYTTTDNGPETVTEWSDQGTSAEFTVFGTTTALKTKAEKSGRLLMLPQDFKTYDATIVVVYTVKTAGSEEGAVTNTVSIKLSEFKKDDKVITWDKNKSILYTLTIGLKPILFSASATSWDDETDASYTIE